ncbi:MAG: nucleotide modification associated domain-containing protein [Candidatus Aenigmatarchaeota archaeon]
MKENIKQIALEIVNLLEEKNTLYGNSYKETRDEYGYIAFLIRLQDKINRIKTLYTKENLPKSEESIEDTLKDIIGYCLLELEYLKSKKGGKP